MGIRLDDIIGDAQSIGISGHIRPDGDCAGSSLGVYNYIRTYFPDRDTHLILEPIPEIFNFLSGSDEIEEPEDEVRAFDLFIVLDCGEIGRLGNAGHYFNEAKRTFCVDHHISNTDFADVNYVYPDASSTCELVGRLIDHERITKEIAECLYTGMVTDTGVFQYSCTHSSTMTFAGELMDKGIDYPTIVDNVFFAKSLTKGKINAVAWDHAKLYGDGKIIGSYVTCDDMEAIGAEPKHMDGITSDLRSTRGVELAIFIYPLPDGSFKGSSRSAKIFDCAAFASKYKGGGHVRAAGFSVEGRTPREWVDLLCNEAAAMM